MTYLNLPKYLVSLGLLSYLSTSLFETYFDLATSVGFYWWNNELNVCKSS